MDFVPPFSTEDLDTDAGRERALDSLGPWLVSQVAEAEDAVAIAAMRQAIVWFYDIRESADQPRSMYAGHFFLVDGVGLDHSDRPVAWDLLAGRVSRKRLDRLQSLFDQAERQAD
jgi:hypothetical protein